MLIWHGWWLDPSHRTSVFVGEQSENKTRIFWVLRCLQCFFVSVAIKLELLLQTVMVLFHSQLIITRTVIVLACVWSHETVSCLPCWLHITNIDYDSPEMESSRPWPWPRGASRTTGHVLNLCSLLIITYSPGMVTLALNAKRAECLPEQ